MSFLTDADKRTIKKGRNAFSPGEGLFPCRSRRWQVQIAFDDSAWWSIEDWQGDQDRLDWNKGGGPTAALGPNDVNAGLLGWRPGKGNIPNTWDVCAYVNDHKGTGRWSPYITVASRHEGEAAFLDLTLNRRDITFQLSGYDVIKEKKIILQGKLPWRRPWYNLYRATAPWIGGANNAKGPYGGEAHKYMEIYSKTISL